jgi:glycosyltransferase involved in cell wall biosynthesis
MKHILILTQFYHPDIAATGQVLTQLAEDIAMENEYKVKVLTGQPSYHSEYKEKYAKKEIVNNVEIIRTNYFRFNKKSNLGRLFGFFSFFISTVLKLPFVGKFDTVIIVSNPPMLPIIGYFLKKIRKVKYIFLLHDLYPDVALRMGFTTEKSLMTKVMNDINKRVFGNADYIVVLGRDAKELLIGKGVDPDKIKIITNWADKKVIDQQVNGQFPIANYFKNKFTILYTGNIGLFYDLEYVIEAVEKIKDITDISLIFVGEGNNKESLKLLVKEKQLMNVHFLPYQSKEHYGQLLRSADVLLVALADGMEGISVPSKSYGYLASAKPLLAILPVQSEIGLVVKENQCGIQVNPKDIEGIESAIIKLYTHPDLREKMSYNARKIFKKKYQRENVTKQFVQLLK